MLSTLLVTGTSGSSLARMLNLEGLFEEDRRRPACLDFSGTYPVGATAVTMTQSGCDGEVFVAGRRHWTYTVDPATGVATASRPDVGTGNLIDGRVVWSRGGVWGEPFPEVPAEPAHCDMDMAGTYLSHQNFKEVEMVQSGCSGEVFVDGMWQWTFEVDPVTGVATSSRPDQGEGILVGGTITWDNGHVWGPVTGGCTGLSQKPMGSVCYGDPSTRTILGDWKTESCESKCERFLAGRKGCCNQKNNKNLCWALLGGRTEGVVARAGDVHWQAIDCNQPEYDGDEYEMSDNALNCPPGFEIIGTQSECETANRVLNIGFFRDNSLATNGQGSRVGGCFMQETGYWKLNGNVMFNANLAGVGTSANTGDRRICKKATTGTGGASVCPPPSAPDARGRGCPPPAAGQKASSSCINNNWPYDTLADAWAACAEEPECDTITEWGPDMPLGETKFRLRRNTDPTHIVGKPCGYNNCEGAGYTFTC